MNAISISHKKRSFTLIETMIATAIFAIIIGAMLATLYVGRKSWDIGIQKVGIQQDARIGTVKMVKELRQARIKEIAVDKKSINFYLPVGVSGGITVWGTDEIQYLEDAADLNGDGLTNQVLRRVIGSSDTPRVIAINVANVQFTLLPSAEEVEVALTTQKESFSRSISVALTSQVALRNQ